VTVKQLAVELETDLGQEHKKKCRKCSNDQFYVFDDYDAGRTDVVCVKCGELTMDWG
jgi:ribosomal protein S27E